MKKIKLLSGVALGLMLAISPVYADNLNNAAEEEVSTALRSVLKKNPKIVYDAVLQYRDDVEANKTNYKEEYTPLEEKVATILKENPAFVVGALQIYEQEQQQKELVDLTKVYREHITEINEGDLIAGNPNGKYTLVEFFDFSCGYCKKMAPHMKKIIDKNPDVKVVFKPVAFLSKSSEYAAKGAIAAARQGKFLDMYVKIMEKNRVTETDLEGIAKDIGLDMEKYKKDYADKKTNEDIEKIKKTADNIGMKSVPTLIIDGMPLYATEEVQIQHAIDVLRNN
jgi:protein-disulfide isomerase